MIPIREIAFHPYLLDVMKYYKMQSAMFVYAG